MALILMYHRIAREESDPWSLCVTPENFAEQVQVVKNIGIPLHMNELAGRLENRSLTRNSIAITFDDGFVDNLYNAKPILEENKVPGTVFLVTDYLQRKQEFWFEELEGIILGSQILPSKLPINMEGKEIIYDLGDSANFSKESNKAWRAFEDPPPTPRHSLFLELWKKLRPMRDIERRKELDRLWKWSDQPPRTRPQNCALSLEEVQLLEKGGIIEIGSHTKTHPQLSQLSTEEQRKEVGQSKSFLESLIGHQVTSFAYPYGWHGDYSSVTVQSVMEAGYSSSCTTIPGKVDLQSDPFQLNRIAVGNWNGKEFSQRITGYLIG